MSVVPLNKHQRLAVLSDVHGNAWALRAVLADGERHRPDGWIVLGDLLADGPDPVGTLALLRSLPAPRDRVLDFFRNPGTDVPSSGQHDHEDQEPRKLGGRAARLRW